MAMRFTLHPYQRLKTKQRWNWQRHNQHHVDRLFTGVICLPDARQPDESRSLPSEHMAKRTVHPCRSNEPFAISNENGNRRIFSEKNHYHAHSGGCGNRMPIALLLTTDGEAIIVKVWKSNGDGSTFHHR